MTQICWLSPTSPPPAFPDVKQALTEPNGLLAAGGDLSSERLVYAYTHGIFPWYSDNEPILWWAPDPRAVLRRDDGPSRLTDPDPERRVAVSSSTS